MLTILITGIAGFIGSNLADRPLRDPGPRTLDPGTPGDGPRVIGIDNLSYGVREQIPAGVQFYQEDIRSKAIYHLFRGVDYVFHFAAKNCIADCQADPVGTADINVTGTVNVFEAARRAGVTKVIYAESSALYEGCDTLPSTDAVVKPESFYAVSKLATMHFAEAYQRFHGPSPSPTYNAFQIHAWGRGHGLACLLFKARSDRGDLPVVERRPGREADPLIVTSYRLTPMTKKRLAILTGGGDAPPLNALIASAIESCNEANIELIGFIRGWQGLLENCYVDLSDFKVNPAIGGTALKSSRVKLDRV